jgi:hypothetical protein
MYSSFWSDFNKTSNFHIDFRNIKYQISWKYVYVAAELSHADRRTSDEQ